ncbi:beta-1,4-glucuronyltransferase 1-like [Tubulanus polymorphus]|uniref:beta-1,4-glucuronyltransferase 1-like n=1 Tax=Tubulanus polymorphus TaxID=672921 RepID=UPI003DA51D6F
MNTIRVNWCKLTSGLVIALIILQLFYATLLTQYNVQKEINDRDRKAFLISSEFDRMKRVYENRHVIDSSGHYSIIPRIWIGSEMYEQRLKRDVTLVIHCSINRMYHLADIAKLWKGPISVVVFTPGQDAIVAMEHIIRLDYCEGSLMQRIVFHFVAPLTLPARDLKMYSNLDDRSICRLAFREMKMTKDIESYGIRGVKYPNNLLRNVGIRHSQTEYILVADADLAPKRTLREEFLEFANRNDLFSANKMRERVVYVIPVFETINEESIPYDRRELFQGLNDGFIRQFYIEPCPKCQGIMDYDKWIVQYKNLKHSAPLDIAYFKNWSHPWEPFFIAHRNIPLYDERFMQYGYNRVSQICEMFIAEYHFAVLNHAFIIHMGHKLKHGFHESKQEEMFKNRQLLHQFKIELKTKYPQSSRQC